MSIFTYNTVDEETNMVCYVLIRSCCLLFVIQYMLNSTTLCLHFNKFHLVKLVEMQIT